MSRLLIKESPVMIIPSLAVRIGLNEAVVLQQIHSWLGISKHKLAIWFRSHLKEGTIFRGAWILIGPLGKIDDDGLTL